MGESDGGWVSATMKQDREEAEPQWGMQDLSMHEERARPSRSLLRCRHIEGTSKDHTRQSPRRRRANESVHRKQLYLRTRGARQAAQSLEQHKKCPSNVRPRRWCRWWLLIDPRVATLVCECLNKLARTERRCGSGG
eukprot:3215665-Pleurochrysis_carterae.AAC.1